MRILYILNHITVCKSEPPFIVELGHEIYISKLWPYNTRSGGYFADYDHTLTLPPEVKAHLDQQDLYKEWSVLTTRYINQYFDVVFVACFPELIVQALRKFRGDIVLRSFGGSITGYCVGAALESAFGTAGTHLLRKNLHRLHYLQAFDVLQEFEPEWLRPRAWTVQATMEDAFWQKQMGTHQPLNQDVIMVMPDIMGGDRLSRRAYKQVKRHLRALDYVVLGKQEQPVPDIHVKGYTTDAEYDAYMHNGRVMFYHNDVPHHLHYHPVEAACIGMPVIFMNQGYLGRLTAGQAVAGCNSYAEARHKLKRIIDGETEFTAAVIAEQKSWAIQFHPDNCRRQMQAFFAKLPAERSGHPLNTKTPPRKVTFFSTRKDFAFQAHLNSVWRWLCQRYPSAQITLALDSEAYSEAEAQSLRNRALPVVLFNQRTLNRDQSIVLAQMTGLATQSLEPLLRPKGRSVVPQSASGDFMDQDLWWLEIDACNDYWLPMVRTKLFAHAPQSKEISIDRDKAKNRGAIPDLAALLDVGCALSDGIFATNRFARQSIVNTGLNLDFYDLSYDASAFYGSADVKHPALAPTQDMAVWLLLPTARPLPGNADQLPYSLRSLNELQVGLHAAQHQKLGTVWVPYPDADALTLAWLAHSLVDHWWLADTPQGHRFADCLGLTAEQWTAVPAYAAAPITRVGRVAS